MRLSAVIRSLVLTGLLAASAQGLSTVHVDFQISRTAGVTAPGYVAIDNTSRWDTGAQVTLDTGVQGGWTAYVHGSGRDRATADPLMRDLFTWSTGTTDTFKMAGLQPGSYTLTVYSYDPSYPASVYKTGVNIDGNNDSVNETSLVILQSLTPTTTPVTVSSAGILLINFAGTGATGLCNGFDLTAGVPDITPPAAITDLSVTTTSAASVSLRWTAPTDNSGKAASYNIRYSTMAISDDTTFAAATPATGAPVPATPGQQENFTVSGLSPATLYYFAIKSADSSGNVSNLSNVAMPTTQAPDTTAPAAVTDLAATAIGRNQLTLTWTATGDDGSTGTATTYSIRYSASPITDGASFAAAAALTGLPAPKAAGSAETFTVTGLQPATTYYFAMKVADEVPDWSGLSNLLQVTTLPPDVTAPAAVTDLSVTNTTGSAALLQWTAPADDSGKAASYDLRYSTSPITQANWASAAQATGEPVPASPGQSETFTVSGLAPTTKYYFAVKSADGSGNVSTLSNVVTGTTLAKALRSDVHVDFQIAGCTTASGYAAVLNTNRLDNGTWADLGGGVRGGWTAAFVGDNRDRATADALTRDFLIFTSGAAAQTFQMRGLQPGTYNLKFYATDTSFHSGTTLFTIDQNNDGASDVSLTIDERVGETTKTASVTVSMAGIVSIAMSSGASGRTGLCNGLDLVAATDTLPPSAVTDLVVTNTNSTQATLRWTAPADDNGGAGGAASYDIRYATSPIDAASWTTANQATAEPTPSNPGQPETFTVIGLTPGTTYFFAVKAVDFDSNAAPLSNVPWAMTQAADLVAPSAVTTLAATGVDANWLTLTWTSTGDDGTSGTATTYDVRYSTSPITDDTSFAAATVLTGVPAPKIAGTAQTFLATGLTGSTTYWFAMKVADEMPGWSGLSNVVQVTTLPPDVTPPAAIADLAASNLQSNMVTLTWTASGDDGNTGTAVSYDIRYSTTQITDDAQFAAAESFANVPVPKASGSAEHFLAGNLQADTTYYFAIKTTDNGVPANVSVLSNVVTARTLAAGSLAYAVSNEFSLEAAPSGPYAPAIPVAGNISITNINVDQAAITRSLSSSRSGPVYTGAIHYDLAASTSPVHVWLELSSDGGLTWSQRRIHAVGAVGTISPGSGLMAQWLVDGDQGNHCKIRIRVNGNRATYSNIDSDNNKYPRPAPWDEYPTIERMTDSKDFLFTDARYTLPHVDFYKSLSAGQMRVGFARVGFFNSGSNNVPNPQYFLHACYLESMDGQQKYLILTADAEFAPASMICAWRDQIYAACGIPKDHVMVMYTHVHHDSNATEDNVFPLNLLSQAMANAQPAEIGWLNKDMGTSYSTHRDLLTDPTHAYCSFSNYLYDPYPSQPSTDVLWQYDTQGNIIGALLDGRPWNSPCQQYYDGPLDSYLQTIVFRNAQTHALTGMLCKFTTHPVNRDCFGDLPRCIMDTVQARLGSNVEVMWTCGFCGNNRPVASQGYPAALGSPRMANGFAQAIVDALPTTAFAPLTKLGMVIGYDMFGGTGLPRAVGTDPDRVGTGVRVWRLNDIYFSTLPCEAPQEQGLYIRGRTSDLKHMYDAYGDGCFIYYAWGRWFDIQHYENMGFISRYESFRMAQELTRGVAILEQSVDALHMPGDINGDGVVDMVDLLVLANAWASVTGNANFDANCDLNNDGVVNVIDLLTLAEYWGT